ncbi:hypothetical protein ZWY2020_021449 [Hordeum vulgare]|nr:hypothetical protein ZWY2020_021449 [Hordeum vulgare]
MKCGIQPACDQGRPRICAPGADGGHDEAVREGRPRGERGSSVYMAVNPVFRLGLLDYLDGSPTKLLPVLDIASSSSFCQCFKLMSCCVMPTSSEYSPFCRSCWNLVVLPSSSESSCQCSIQDPSFRVLELY